MRQLQSASWRNSSNVCAYANEDRHLGHIVRTGEGWIAFDATHSTTEGNAFRPLGFFRTSEDARQAVECATEPAALMVLDPVTELRRSPNPGGDRARNASHYRLEVTRHPQAR